MRAVSVKFVCLVCCFQLDLTQVSQHQWFWNSIFATNDYAFLGHSRLQSYQNRINATVPFHLQSLFLNS